MNVRFVAYLLVAVAGVAVSSNADAQRRRFSGSMSRVDTNIALPKGGTVSVMASNGDIVVTGWSRDQVHVRGSSDNGDIRVRVVGSRLEIGGMRGGGDSRMEISVPFGAKVIATSLSGDVSVRGTRGAVEVHAQSGDVQVEDVTTRLSVTSLSGDITASAIAGDVAAETVSGDVHVSDLRGDADIVSVSGEVAIRGANSRIVRARTTSGDVVYDGLIDAGGRYEMTSHSGDIRLHVQRDASAQISVSTWSGTIDSDFTMTLKSGEHGVGSSKAKGLTFSIGGGAAHIVADTFSGDINISANGHGASTRRP